MSRRTSATALKMKITLDGQKRAHALCSLHWADSSAAKVLMPVGWNVMDTLPLAPS
jgi:hypothetical protein